MDDEYSLSRRKALALMGVSASLTGCLSQISASRSYIPEMVWRRGTQGEVVGDPTVCNGILYIGAWDGYLYAFEDREERRRGNENVTVGKHDIEGTNAPDSRGPQNPVEKWKFSTEDIVAAAPIVVDGDVYFGSVDNRFYSVSSETGEKNWRIETNGAIGGSAVYSDGVVYFPSGHSGRVAMGTIPLNETGEVHAVDPNSGDKIWTVEREEGVQTSLVAKNGLLYSGCQDGKLYAMDAETGNDEWEFQADDNFCASRPALNNGMLYVGSEDGSLYALDPDNGDLLWEFKTGGMVTSGPVAAEDAIYFGSFDNNLYAVNPDTGNQLWSFETDAGIFSSPAYSNGVVYVGSQDGNLYAVDGKNGDIEWVENTEAPVMSSPVVTEDTVYFGSNDDRIYAVMNKSVDEDTYEKYRKKLREEGYGGMNRTEIAQSRIAEELNEEEREAVGLEGDEDGRGGQAEEG